MEEAGVFKKSSRTSRSPQSGAGSLTELTKMDLAMNVPERGLLGGVHRSRTGSVSSVGSAKSDSAAMASGKSSKRTRTDEDDECMMSVSVEAMKMITRRLNGLLMREKINRPVIEEVLSLASDYEGTIYKAMLENELLKGRLLELERERESMRKENLRREEVWKQERERDAIHMNEVATSKLGVSDMGMSQGKVGKDDGKKDDGKKVRKSYAVIVKSDKNESSEVVKERVLKEVSPWVNVRVRGVRKLKSGGVAIETASERELDSLRASAKFRQCGMNVELPLIFDVRSALGR
ncbi:hypothetical protein QE152_g5683 [Popillia japonica]|uniref:Uncharacterized protein n=1 Tax=Popillia japonica TaxID=7064 RepID=A0AAW1MLZ5_POPJA